MNDAVQFAANSHAFLSTIAISATHLLVIIMVDVAIGVYDKGRMESMRRRFYSRKVTKLACDG